MKQKFSLCLSLALILAVGFSLFHPPAVNAMNQNRIADDTIFDNIYTMGAGQIDVFLNQFPSSCISPVRGFSSIDPIGYSPSTGFKYSGFVSAGRVIADSAQTYGINPQVLLTTLEKEEGLVRGDGAYGCSPLALSASMGYGCTDAKNPDGSIPTHNYSGINLYAINGNAVTSVNGTCVNSAAKAGFSQQVIRAAWLLKFGEQRSEGNINWAVIKGDWDNSDDPQSCYSGPMTQGYRQICPSGATVFYDGYSTIDGTTIHIDSGSTAALYWYTPHFHGNQIFSDTFSQWFGSTTLPYAFKSPSSATVYMSVNGLKVAVPYMGMLQDYGISPESIQTLAQSTVDSIPSPGTSDGISATLSYIVKSPSDTDADGGSLYLVSIGKKYAFASMQQFQDYGFSQSNIAYMPLNFLDSIPSGLPVSNYIHTPNPSAFQVSGGQKRIIFDYPTYRQLNPSDVSTPVSYFIANLVASGSPISNKEILVKYNTSDAVYLLANSNYYTVPTSDIYSCWGFEGALRTPVFTVADNSYISSINPTASLPGCLLNDSAGTNYLLSHNNKYILPSSYGITGTIGVSQSLIDIAAKLPTNSSPLKPFVKSNQAAAVWYLQGGARRVVPTYANFLLFNLDSSQFDTLDNAALPFIPDSGHLKLAPGTLVKTDTSAAVYTISANNRVFYSTSNDFSAYGNDWPGIETYPQATLDQDYPSSGVSVNRYLYVQSSNTVYLVDKEGCYALDASLLTSYGQSQNAIAAGQSYTSAVFPKFNSSNCKSGSVYIKSPDQSVVYWVDNGQKHPIYAWNTLVAHSHQTNPYVATLTASALATLPTSTPL